MALFRSILDKLKSGLAKTRESLGGALRHLLSGKTLSEEVLRELEKTLIQADVGVATATALRAAVEAAWRKGEMKSGDEAFDFIRQHIIAAFPAQDRQLHFAENGPTVILVCGINGAGKTTSIAKLCKILRDQNKTVCLAACDTFRAAAVEQLEIWAGRMDVDIIKGKPGSDPASVAFDAADKAQTGGADVLIVDTAGRLHTQDHLMRQLAKIKSVLAKKIPGAPHEVLLVIDATTGQNGVQQARIFSEATPVTGLFLSKLDGTAKGGVAVAIREQLQVPVKFVGTGETPDDAAPFDPESFVEALFAA